MPCDGPHQEDAYKAADAFCAEVLVMLKERYQVQEPMSGWPALKGDHEKAKEQLRSALRELIWVEYCDSW